MSILSSLSLPPGARSPGKRWGRGKGSGRGGTSTKGHKGQKARSGHKPLRGFEGGQMPLARRLPKFGFTNARFKVRYNILNVSDLNRFEKEITPEILRKAGVVSKGKRIKILGQGKLTKKLTVKAHRFSNKAQEIIKKAGGAVQTIKESK